MELPLRLHQRPPQTWELGYDFGSTNSAAAFCLTSASIDGLTAATVYPVTGYKRAKGNRTYPVPSCEVPTIIRYEDCGRRVRWGWDALSIIERGQDRVVPGHVLELFKYGIDDHESTEEQRLKIADLLAALPFQKTVEDVLSDYLTKHFLHIEGCLRAAGYCDGDNIHLTFTVPALWSIRAKRKMIKIVEAVTKASKLEIDNNISICSEPEAATVYVFYKCENIHWKEGDTFVVCDAGGVTIDVVTYSIVSVSPPRMKEVVKGAGAFCGSSKLNESFQQQVELRLIEETYLNEILNGKPLEKLIQNAVSIFETSIKREFVGDELGEDIDNDGREDLPYQWIPIPGLREDKDKLFESSDMAVTRAHVETVFKPNLEAAWKIVEAQLIAAYGTGREPGRLLLVGGYGASERLKVHFQQNCDLLATQLNRRQIRVMVPDTPGNAVAEGAIYRALNQGMVEDNVSRSSICITRHDPLDRRQKVHKDLESQFDDLEGRNYVFDCVKILLKMNQMVPSTGLLETVHFHCTLPADKDFLELVVPIYVYDDGNGVDGLPLSHLSNKGYELLEKVSFKIDVRQIRHRFQRMKVGTSRVSEPTSQPSISKMSNIKTRLGSKRQGGFSTPASVQGNGKSTRLPLTPPLLGNGDILEVQDPASYYFWVDYHFRVEFKDMLMSYQLVIKNVDEIFTGQFNLAPILEPCM